MDGDRNIKDTALIPFLLAIILLVLDFGMGFNGIPVESFKNFISAISVLWRTLVALVIGVILLVFLTNSGKATKQTAFIAGLLAFVFFLIVLFGGALTLPHLLMLALIIYFLKDDAGIEKKMKVLIIFYIIDFFVYGVLNLLLTNLSISMGANASTLRYVFPIFLIYVLSKAQTYESTSFLKTLYTLLLVGLIISWFLFTIDKVYMYNQMKTMSPDEIAKGVKGYFSKVFSSAADIFNQVSSGVTQAFNQSNYIYGGTQEVTENPQGVYIKQLEQGDITYRDGDPVIVWAQVEARTLKEPIDMKINCQAVPDDEDLETIDGIVDEEEKSKELELTVYTSTERSVPCFFSEESSNLLKAGSYEIVFNATFNFAAESELKVYLMDRDRMIRDYGLLRDKGIEQNKESLLTELYKITDTVPESLYTSGPIGLGIGTDAVPWEIGQSNNQRMQFGVSVMNLWSQGGKIQSIDELKFKVPEEMELQIKSCDVKTNQVGSENGYKVYAIAPAKPIPSIETFRSFRCFIVVDHKALDNTPLTVRFLKSSVKYTYLLQESIPIEVDEIPKTDEEAAIESRTKICCHIITGSSSAAKETYEWMQNETECLSRKSSYSTAEVVINSLCEAGKKCCEVSEEGPSTNYYWVDSAEECTTLGKNSRGSILLASEDNHFCN